LAEIATRVINKPVWVDLATSDAGAARDFYSKLFGWQVEVNPDPQYGGYGLAKVGGQDAAGIGPKQSEQQPTAWSLYIGTDDVDGLSQRISEAGGTIISPPFDVGDQGRMAVFQDPSGAFISAWQTARMGGFANQGPNTFGWAELNARGVDRAIPFYERVFGWTTKTTPATGGFPPYTEFQIDGQSICGAFEIGPEVPAEVPSYWLIYFNADDIDATARKAVELGAREIVSPVDYPGGRFCVLSDPQGATFGLLKTSQA
jgi:predicted enzyme related to lactoylglutathione lyase